MNEDVLRKILYRLRDPIWQFIGAIIAAANLFFAIIIVPGVWQFIGAIIAAANLFFAIIIVPGVLTIFVLDFLRKTLTLSNQTNSPRGAAPIVSSSRSPRRAPVEPRGAAPTASSSRSPRRAPVEPRGAAPTASSS